MPKPTTQLNAAQEQAVLHGEGPLCIIAGAGTGKTRVITQRIIHLIKERQIPADQILAITFTEKGTEEMTERLIEEIPEAEDLWIHTFHGFCNRLIGENPLETGIRTDVKLIEESEKYLLMIENFDRFDLKYFRTEKNPISGIPTLLKMFSSLKTESVDPQGLDGIVISQTKALKAELEGGTYSTPTGIVKPLTPTKIAGLEEEILKIAELARAYHTYQEILAEKNLIEYGDMITAVLDMLEGHPSIRQKYQDQFQYILVDEYQDTNTTQNRLIDLLVSDTRNLTVVGDDDQAIFRFQGASLKNILEFNEKYSDAKKVILTENYRSNESILNASYDLIQNNNPHRLETQENINKKLEAKGNVPDEKITIYEADSTFGQWQYITDTIESLTTYNKGSQNNEDPQNNEAPNLAPLKYSDIAILYRNHSSGRAIASQLELKALPHIILGGQGLFDTNEVHGLKCILRAITDIEDSVNMFKVMTLPVFDITLENAIRISSYASRNQKQITDILTEQLEDLLASGEIEGLTYTPSELQFQTDNAVYQQELQDYYAALEKQKAQTIETGVEPTEKLTYPIEPPGHPHSVIRFRDTLASLRELAKAENITTLLFHVFEKTGYLQKYVDTQNIENIQKIYNINAFFSLAEKFVSQNPALTCTDFLAYLEKIEKGGENPAQGEVSVSVDAINLMTIHKSKGLEFKAVFIIDASEGKIPGKNIGSPITLEHQDVADRDAFIAEERRLFYVAMTRAQQKLFITTARKAPGRKTEMKPSRFSGELPPSLIEKVEEDASETSQILAKLLTKPRKVALDHELLRSMTAKIRLSATQIGSYIACPLNYKYKFLYQIPGKPDPATRGFGIAIHAALYEFHQAIKEGQESGEGAIIQTKEDLLEHLRDNWSHEGFFDMQQSEDLLAKGMQILSTYYDTHQDSFASPLFLEEEFSYSLDDISLKGTIDRIDRIADYTDPATGEIDDKAVCIIDYKTGKYKSPKQIQGLRAEQRLYFQALFYTVVAREKLGLNPIKTSFYFIEENRYADFTFTDQDIQDLKDQIRTVDASIKECLFDPTPDMQLCKWCDYRILCPTTKKSE